MIPILGWMAINHTVEHTWEAGAYTSWFATACTVFANLLLLKILPRSWHNWN